MITVTISIETYDGLIQPMDMANAILQCPRFNTEDINAIAKHLLVEVDRARWNELNHDMKGVSKCPN